jgi:hypothetical protein
MNQRCSFDITSRKKDAFFSITTAKIDVTVGFCNERDSLRELASMAAIRGREGGVIAKREFFVSLLI